MECWVHWTDDDQLTTRYYVLREWSALFEYYIEQLSNFGLRSRVFSGTTLKFVVDLEPPQRHEDKTGLFPCRFK